MLTMEQLCEEIECIEDKKPTQDLCNKLASLYIIKDHMLKEMDKAETKPGMVSHETGVSATMSAPSMSMSK